LVEALERHPDIALARPLRPEPKFFLVDELYEQGLEHYSRTWFDSLPADAVIGEKSTNYLEHAHVAARVAQALPAVKVMFLLRDPVERAWSNWRWSTANGMEDLDFTAALDAEAARERDLDPALRYARPHAYLSRGRYAQLLRPWLELLGRDRVLVLRQEDLMRQPTQIAGVHTFLGVEPRPADAVDVGTVNATPGPPQTMPDDVRADLRRRFEEPNRELVRLLGPDFAGWG
jgi:hypothetical protein